MLDAQTREPDFDDGSKTDTPSAYPLQFIPNASRTGRAPHPKNVAMLAADAFGVMPPIAKLTPAQAMYHFLSGYTAEVACAAPSAASATSRSLVSTCFGLPFLPLDPSVYGNLLRELIAGQAEGPIALAGSTPWSTWQQPRPDLPDADEQACAPSMWSPPASGCPVPDRERFPASLVDCAGQASKGITADLHQKPGARRTGRVRRPRVAVGRMFRSKICGVEQQADADVRGPALLR